MPGARYPRRGGKCRGGGRCSGEVPRGGGGAQGGNALEPFVVRCMVDDPVIRTKIKNSGWGDAECGIKYVYTLPLSTCGISGVLLVGRGHFCGEN